MGKTYILFNPLSGKGISVDTAKSLNEKFYNSTGVLKDLTLIIDYKEFLSSLEEEDVLVIYGGDGTINRLVNNLDLNNIKHKIYFYAGGTGNDFLNDLGIKDQESPIALNKYLVNLPKVRIDGNESYFINGVGFGIDGYCCQVGDIKKLKGEKDINYTMIAIKGLLFDYKPTNAKITVDGKTYEYDHVWLAPTMKGRYYGGGMIPTPNQDRLDVDKKVSVMVFRGKSKLGTLMIFPSIFKGEHIKKEKAVTIMSGHHIKVEFDEPRAAQIDGETVLNVTEYEVIA